MSTLTIKFHGIQDEILKAITESGIAESKSEAIRMALLKFGLDLGILDSKEILAIIHQELHKIPLTPDQVAKDIKKAKHASISR
jgi:hypothetical protein